MQYVASRSINIVKLLKLVVKNVQYFTIVEGYEVFIKSCNIVKIQRAIC